MTSNAVAVFSKVENPMEAAVAIGNALHQGKILGVETPGDGTVVALTCMCEGITPLEFARTYHLVDGKPSMRADAMLAKFRQNGGKHKWLDTGEGSDKAEGEFTYDGQTVTVRFTLEDGKRAVGDKFDKAGSNWQKDPAAMLRARCQTRAIRMLAPELIAGLMEESEAADVASSNGSTATVEVVSSQPVSNPPAVSPQAIPVTEPEQAPQQQEVPFEASTTPLINQALELGGKLGLSPDNVRAGILQAAQGKGVQADAVEHVSAEIIQAVIDKMQSAITAKNG